MPTAPPHHDVVHTLLNLGTFAGLTVGYLLGHARARWVRARSDYRDTKARVPGLRKKKWGHWWVLARNGAIALVVTVVAVILLSRTAEAVGR
ncbi:MAG: hypothetical protein FWF90_05140 [Promicromonosporaceae bacterium]|nr:hypothetical protein [Promicromonosporaceae bacterium]